MPSNPLRRHIAATAPAPAQISNQRAVTVLPCSTSTVSRRREYGGTIRQTLESKVRVNRRGRKADRLTRRGSLSGIRYRQHDLNLRFTLYAKFQILGARGDHIKHLLSDPSRQSRELTADAGDDGRVGAHDEHEIGMETFDE